MTVTDDDGQSDSDTVNISIVDRIFLPVANAGDDQNAVKGATVTLNGSGSSDADGTIVSFVWEEVTTSGVTITNDATTPTATFTAPEVGTDGEVLTFQLVVIDDDGLASKDSVNITVQNSSSSGGGGGCFIGTAADGSPMALHDRVLRKLSSQFAMVNWKRPMAGHLGLLTPSVAHAATLAFVVTMVVLVSSWVTNMLRKRRKKMAKTLTITNG